jgi:hypothetical protein
LEKRFDAGVVCVEIMANEFAIQISAGAVAWYGAIVATASFCFSAFQIWRDSSRIKILFEKGINLYNASPLYEEGVDYIAVTVINKGRRPVRISQANVFIIGKKNRFLLTDSFADHRIQILTEENPKTQFFAKAADFDVDKIFKIVVVDATGNNYIKYVKKIPTFLRIYYHLKKIIKT